MTNKSVNTTKFFLESFSDIQQSNKFYYCRKYDGQSHYRPNMVCFNCNISQKPTNSCKIKENHRGYCYGIYADLINDNYYRCYKCNQTLQYVGPKFKIPKKNNHKEWKKLQNLLDSYDYRKTNCYYDLEDKLWEKHHFPKTKRYNII